MYFKTSLRVRPNLTLHKNRSIFLFRYKGLWVTACKHLRVISMDLLDPSVVTEDGRSNIASIPAPTAELVFCMTEWGAFPATCPWRNFPPWMRLGTSYRLAFHTHTQTQKGADLLKAQIFGWSEAIISVLQNAATTPLGTPAQIKWRQA